VATCECRNKLPSSIKHGEYLKTGATRVHKMRPLQSTYFMKDVLENTVRAQNVILSCLFAVEPEVALHLPFFFVNI
jgi:hypothetical protein